MLAALLIASAALAPCGADAVDDARALLADGDAPAAVELLDAALAEEPDGDDARRLRLALADAHLAVDDPAAAAAALEPHSREDRHDVQHALGRVMHYWGDFEAAHGRTSDLGFYYGEARSRLEQAAELAPDGDTAALVDALELRLYAYGESAEVLADVEEALADHPDDGELRLLAGTARLYELHAKAREHGEAPSAAERAEQDDLAEAAERDLERADAALDDDRTEPHSQLAWLHETRGNARAAVAEAAEVTELLGDDATFDTLYRLARRYAVEGELDASAAALSTITQTAPEALTAWVESEDDVTAVATSLGTAAFEIAKRRDYARAKPVYRALLAAGPANAGMWNDYALMCRDTRDYAESYRAYAAAVAIDDSDPRLLNDTALVLDYHLDRDDEARPLYERAIDLAESELKQLGLSSERKAYLREALRDAKNNLARLR